MPSLSDLKTKLSLLLKEAGLSRISAEIMSVSQPAILIELIQRHDVDIAIGDSKIGGAPDLPADYSWPEWQGRSMGFLGQFNLSQVSRFDFQDLLPKTGLLSFFYDLYEMPWGYDPQKQGYSRVAYFPLEIPVIRREVPDKEIELLCSEPVCSPMLTIPVFGSKDYEKFVATANLTEEEDDIFGDFHQQVQAAYRQKNSATFHQLLGHAHNIQGDMQLEAELVTNGLYCGDQSGYLDPRRKTLETQASEWQLLFELDSDDAAGLEWGDVGTLYYWIKRADLANRRFEKHWMDLQCY